MKFWIDALRDEEDGEDERQGQQQVEVDPDQVDPEVADRLAPIAGRCRAPAPRRRRCPRRRRRSSGRRARPSARSTTACVSPA
ncbi:MAG: hypothetical protein MZW92_10505 [Comamonadaceae bacterium]|nr:hypothetical protein [Comamonadaceae bacterium]